MIYKYNSKIFKAENPSPDCSGNPASGIFNQNKVVRATREARNAVSFVKIPDADWSGKRVSAPVYFKNLKDKG
jgi:hypothetical protein